MYCTSTYVPGHGHSLKYTNPSWQLKTVFPKVRLVDHQRVNKEKMRKFYDAIMSHLLDKDKKTFFPCKSFSKIQFREKWVN